MDFFLLEMMPEDLKKTEKWKITKQHFEGRLKFNKKEAIKIKKDLKKEITWFSNETLQDKKMIVRRVVDLII